MIKEIKEKHLVILRHAKDDFRALLVAEAMAECGLRVVCVTPSTMSQGFFVMGQKDGAHEESVIGLFPEYVDLRISKKLNELDKKK